MVYQRQYTCNDQLRGFFLYTAYTPRPAKTVLLRWRTRHGLKYVNTYLFFFLQKKTVKAIFFSYIKEPHCYGRHTPQQIPRSWCSDRIDKNPSAYPTRVLALLRVQTPNSIFLYEYVAVVFIDYYFLSILIRRRRYVVLSPRLQSLTRYLFQ